MINPNDRIDPTTVFAARQEAHLQAQLDRSWARAAS